MKYLTLFLAVFAVLPCIAAPQHPDEDIPSMMPSPAERAQLARCVSDLRGLPRDIRDALICEKAQFLYMEDGSSPYTTKTKQWHKTEHVWFLPVKKQARFVGTDGKSYSFYSVIDKVGKHEKWQQAWRRVKAGMEQMGEETVLAFFEKEVKKMEEYYSKALDLHP